MSVHRALSLIATAVLGASLFIGTPDVSASAQRLTHTSIGDHVTHHTLAIRYVHTA